VPQHLRPIDYARAARIALGMIDGDLERSNRVLMDANDDDAVHLLLAALTQQLIIAMGQPAISDDGIRHVFERTILDAQMAGTDE